MEPSRMAGKAAGKAKSVGKAIQGYGGIFRQLSEEHGEVSALLKRLLASDEDSEAREELFPTLRKELLSHAKAEEKEFYSVLRERSETRDLVRHGIDEHGRVERLLDQLQAMDSDSDDWTDTLRQLSSAVEDHVKEEENELFPKAKDLIAKGDAEKLKTTYLAAKEREMGKIL